MKNTKALSERRKPNSAIKAHTKMLDAEIVKKQMRDYDDKMSRATENRLQVERQLKDNMGKMTSKVLDKLSLKAAKEEQDYMDVFSKSVTKRKQR